MLSNQSHAEKETTVKLFLPLCLAHPGPGLPGTLVGTFLSMEFALAAGPFPFSVTFDVDQVTLVARPACPAPLCAAPLPLPRVAIHIHKLELNVGGRGQLLRQCNAVGEVVWWARRYVGAGSHKLINVDVGIRCRAIMELEVTISV
ncbi:hypothetical protein BC936DRAFT_137302 [Jimgerdemannia flammicorona]|uniref:Uncharacterized protein n=1 Tax=Jimgerdemannia flammicorona TaxID=994334 RepID=A0A433DJ35_9FUNG|nr:hypothetical protein BC936DRAFT_137302 [Jimgerdemannia flammicorona]